MNEKSLIQLVKRNKPLWDVNHENYKSEAIKDQLWRDIATEMNANYKDVKEKWVNLRVTFRKEYEKLMIPSENGATHYSKWKHFKPLLFLSDYIFEEDETDKSNSEETAGLSDDFLGYEPRIYNLPDDLKETQ